MKLRAKVLACVAVLGLAGCTGPRAPLNPPQLVTDSDSDMAVQLFMQATLAMAKYHGYTTLSYGELSKRAELKGLSTLPFMPPEMVTAAPPLRGANAVHALDNVAKGTDTQDFDPDKSATVQDFRSKVNGWKYGYEGLVRYYIITGWKASQIVCRNFMLRLDERNQYLDFLRKEFGVGYSLASGILTAVHANGALTTAFLLANTGTNNAIEEYQNYRFLQIGDREAARVLVSAAQDRYAEYFLRKVASAKNPLKSDEKRTTLDVYTFAEALDAVSTIEYQCTREGVRNLANKTLNNSPTNLIIDPVSGALVFRSNLEAVENALIAEDKNTKKVLGPGRFTDEDIKKQAEAAAAKKAEEVTKNLLDERTKALKKEADDKAEAEKKARDKIAAENAAAEKKAAEDKAAAEKLAKEKEGPKK